MGEDTKPNDNDVADADEAKPAVDEDLEARLKDKLAGKKVEKDLKTKLMAKKERRLSEGSTKDGKKESQSPSNSSDRRGSRDRDRPVGPYRPPHRRGGPPPGWGPRGPRDPYGREPPPYRGGPRNYGPPPPHVVHRGGPHFYDEDPYGRAPRRTHRYGSGSRSRSRSLSRSYSRSRSMSRSYSRSRSRSRSLSEERSSSKRGRSEDRDRRRGRRRKHRRRRRSRSPSTSGSSVSSSSSSSSSSDESEASNTDTNNKKDDSASDNFTKDQRTVFVNQLVMRTTSQDIKRYFNRKVKAKVNEVILLKDRRTGKHKGFAYVEMKSMEDVNKALNVSGQPPDFQRFPILIKPSEAEKNYLIPASSATITANMMGSKANAGPIMGPNGQLIESQKVYVGSLDPSITQEHLFKLFSQFGDLTKVQLQMDPASGMSKGFAFLSFRDPKEANLAIQTMSNQVLGGRCIKTGWATQQTGTPGVQVVTSEEFPEDASARAQKAHIALAQLAIGAPVTVAPMAAVPIPVAAAGPSAVPTVAEARQNLAITAAMTIHNPSVAATPAAASLESADAKVIGRADNPSSSLLIRNMFDKDEETEPGWADEIKEEFKEECGKFGTITHVLVMSKDPGGKIYASFSSIEAAQNCASSLAGRWFDKRQLRVEFVDSSDIPKEA